MVKRKEFAIGCCQVSDTSEPFIIAEIGNNHDGKLEQAIELINEAAQAGADAVKFQTYNPEKLVTPEHELHGFFSQFQLPLEWHGKLKEIALEAGVQFLSTPFDRWSADFLQKLDVPAFKISSSDLTNLQLIRHCAEFGKPMLISTGMGTIYEAGGAIEAAHMKGCYDIAILHCVSLYPTAVEDSQINAIPEFQRLFQIPVGFSDHSLSPTLPAVAVALGARVIEKHFTLSRDMKGPDHAVALEPHEFKIMSQACKESAKSLRNSGKMITDDLSKVRKASMRGLYATRDLPAGTVISEADIVPLRPATELSLKDVPEIVGKKTTTNIPKGSPFLRTNLG
jgi:sialic acid synthase SpsE